MLNIPDGYLYGIKRKKIKGENNFDPYLTPCTKNQLQVHFRFKCEKQNHKAYGK